MNKHSYNLCFFANSFIVFELTLISLNEFHCFIIYTYNCNNYFINNITGTYFENVLHMNYTYMYI